MHERYVCNLVLDDGVEYKWERSDLLSRYQMTSNTTVCMLRAAVSYYTAEADPLICYYTVVNDERYQHCSIGATRKK